MVIFKILNNFKEFNACSQKPCQNNGNCIQTGNNAYFCECLDLFEGLNCELG